jgi:hypothetical protein
MLKNANKQISIPLADITDIFNQTYFSKIAVIPENPLLFII